MLAAKNSISPALESSTSAMCSNCPAPHLAARGTPTSLMRRVMTMNPSFHAVAVNAVQNNFTAPSDTARLAGSTTSSPCPARPLQHQIETTMACHSNFSPPGWMDWRAPRADAHFVPPRPAASWNISVTDFDAAPDSGHKTLVGGAPDIHHRYRHGGDVEEHHFVRACRCSGAQARNSDICAVRTSGFAELDAARI